MQLTRNTLDFIREHIGENNVLEDYSGRGMSNRTTLAIVCDSKSQLLDMIMDFYQDCDELIQQDIFSDLRTINNSREDTFGKDQVVIY